MDTTIGHVAIEHDKISGKHTLQSESSSRIYIELSAVTLHHKGRQTRPSSTELRDTPTIRSKYAHRGTAVPLGMVSG